MVESLKKLYRIERLQLLSYSFSSKIKHSTLKSLLINYFLQNLLFSIIQFQYSKCLLFIIICIYYFLTNIVISVINFRVRLLAVCTVVFGISIILSGAVTEYWQLVVLRMIMAAGESGCNPLATGILSDLFPEEKRALVMSVFNWGIYGGYGKFQYNNIIF